MFPFGGEKMPYTNFHDMNLDWVIKTILEIKSTVDDGVANINSMVNDAIQRMIDSGEFNDLIAALANSNIFYCVTPNMTQSEIQTALNTYSAVKFTPGTYSVYIPEVNDYGYSIPSDRVIFMDGATIKKSGKFDHDYDTLFLVDGVSNVYICGNGILDYNKGAMIGNNGEHGMCLSIGSSENVYVNGIKCINAFGDGIYLNGNAGVWISDVVCSYNRRNAISIISGGPYRIRDSFFLYSAGTYPEAGIALETNYSSETLSDVVITDCLSQGNNGAFDVYITNKGDYGSVTFNNVKANTPPPITLSGDYNKVTLNNCVFGMKTTNHVFNVECPAHNEIRFNNCEIAGSGGSSSGSLLRYTGTSLHNVFIENCLLHDFSLTGRAVLGLGSLTDVDRIVMNCRSYNFNMDAPTTMLQSTVAGAYLKWSIENMDEKEFTADNVYPFNNYYITDNKRPGNPGKTLQKIKIRNRTESDLNVYASTFLINGASASTVDILDGVYITLESYGASAWVAQQIEAPA